MLSALKFVQGAVGKKDLVPALTHFRILDGRVTGYNGKISLSAPIPLDVDCCPKAGPFVAAIEACEETAQLHLTPTGKLSIKSGKFRAHVDTLVDEFPDVRPEGVAVAIDGQLLPAFRSLYDFTAEDASRPWATGVLLDGQSAYATNNVILVEAWLGYRFPYRVNVPRYTIKEMLRIGEEPIGMQLTVTSITFHYPGDRWLRSQLNSLEWPDVAGLLGRMPADPEEVAPVPEGLWAALGTLGRFVDELGRVYALPGRLATAPQEGASVDIAGMPDAGLYNHKMLSLLDGVADRVGFDAYPHPLPFYGSKMRGLFAGMRHEV